MGNTTKWAEIMYLSPLEFENVKRDVFQQKAQQQMVLHISQTKACRQGRRVQTVETTPRRCYSRTLAKTYTLDSCSYFAIQSPPVV